VAVFKTALNGFGK